VGNRILDWLTHGLFARYGALPLGAAEQHVRHADLLIFESKPGLLLFAQCKRLNPQARYVYRVSDDLRLLRSGHPVVLEAEARYAGQFDLVSVPSPALLQRFQHLPQAVLHRHGIRKDLFAQAGANVVFVGTAYFDDDFLRRASESFPQWGFHIIGPIPHLPRRPNVVAYGEIPFVETVPFIKHADIGLHTLVYKPGAEAFTDSLKVMQYTYCGLPIIAPEYLRSPRPNVLYYALGDTPSIRQALLAARSFDRRKVITDDIRSWDEIAAALAGVPGPVRQT
jgi:2-beta-glucuronyltransferase